MTVETVIWAAVLILFVAVEAMTAQLVTIWFAAGALVSLLMTFFVPDAHLAQFFVFVAVSLVALVITRPILKKHIKPKIQSTNSDAILGKNAVVTEEISNLAGTGRAKTDGKDWTARAVDDDTVIQVGTIVKIERIEGVKIFVKE